MKEYKASIYIFDKRFDGSSSLVIRSCIVKCETMLDALNDASVCFKHLLNLSSVYKVEIKEIK